MDSATVICKLADMVCLQTKLRLCVPPPQEALQGLHSVDTHLRSRKISKTKQNKERLFVIQLLTELNLKFKVETKDSEKRNTVLTVVDKVECYIDSSYSQVSEMDRSCGQQRLLNCFLLHMPL